MGTRGTQFPLQHDTLLSDSLSTWESRVLNRLSKGGETRKGLGKEIKLKKDRNQIDCQSPVRKQELSEVFQNLCQGG